MGNASLADRIEHYVTDIVMKSQTTNSKAILSKVLHVKFRGFFMAKS